jgi:hypothetical protein
MGAGGSATATIRWGSGAIDIALLAQMPDAVEIHKGVKIATFRQVFAITPTIVGNTTIKQHVIRGVAKQVQVGGIC